MNKQILIIDDDEDLSFIISDMYDGTHKVMGETADGTIYDFTSSHDFSNGDCYCGHKAPVYCEGGCEELAFEALDMDVDAGTGEGYVYCQDCEFKVEATFTLVNNGDGTHTIVITTADGDVIEEVEDHYGDMESGADCFCK